MKKFFFVFLILFVPIPVIANASSYIVMDQNSNQILYGSNYNDKSLIASITKIMTAIIVIENSEVDRTITVNDEVLKAYGSAVYLEVGEKIKIKDLLYGLMLRSGNDAAIVLANEVGGSIDDFSVLMNNLAKKLKLKNTTFVNPHGLDEESKNYSTAYDMAVIMSYAMKNDIFREITKAKNYTTKSSYKTYNWKNKNKLLFDYKYTTGGKTGYTELANRTLVTTASKDNMDIVVVTINYPDDFSNHKGYYEKVFKKYESVKVLDKNVTSFEKNYYIKNDYYALVKRGEEKNISVKNKIYNKPVNLIAGKTEVYNKDQLLYTDNIYKYQRSEETLSWWQKIVDWFKSW